MKKQNTWALYQMNNDKTPIKVVALFQTREDARYERNRRWMNGVNPLSTFCVAKVEIKPLSFD